MDPKGCRLDCLPSNGTYIYFKVHVVSTAAWGTLLLLSKGEDRQCGAVPFAGFCLFTSLKRRVTFIVSINIRLHTNRIPQSDSHGIIFTSRRSANLLTRPPPPSPDVKARVSHEAIVSKKYNVPCTSNLFRQRGLLKQVYTHHMTTIRQS